MPNSEKTSKLILLILAVLVLFNCQITEAAPAGKTSSDIKLPYPKSVKIEIPKRRLPYLPEEKYVTAILEIDKKGKVKDVLWENETDSLLVKYFSSNLKSIKFHPGKIMNKNARFYLPVRLQYRVRGRIPDLIFPIDSLGLIADRDWYEKALSLNGFTGPVLLTFPPFFCDLTWTDSSRHYPYCLFQLSLDSQGKLTGIDEISNRYHTFSGQLMSATQWAEFAPAKFDDEDVPSKVYMMVSFFPQLFYPNKKFNHLEYDSYPLLEKMQVRIFNDTVGLLSKPLPKKLKGNEYILGGEHTVTRDTVVGYISINKEGKGKLFRFSKTNKFIKMTIYKIIEQLSFFPAIDYNGDPREFSGMISFAFEGSSTIRINYYWLP